MIDPISLEKELTKLERYLAAEGRKDFIDEIRAASPETRDQKILSLAKHRQEIKDAQAEDVDLKAAKDHARALGATYREQLRMNDKLARFIALVTKE